MHTTTLATITGTRLLSTYSERILDGRVVLSPAQLSMLLEGIDWRMPVRTHVPELAA